MKANFKALELNEMGVSIHVYVPNPITNTKHANLIAGIKELFLSCESFYDLWYETPFGMAEAFIDAVRCSDGEGTRSYMLAENLTKFPVRDFIRFGDVNHIKSVSRAWFSDSGVSIDVQVEIINDIYSSAFTTDQIIEHVMQYKPGKFSEPLADEIDSIRSNFRNKFGVTLTIPYASYLIGLGMKEEPVVDDIPF